MLATCWLFLAALPAQAFTLNKAERKVQKRARFEYPNKTAGRTVTATCHRVTRKWADCTYKVGPDPFDCGRYGDCRKLHGTGTVKKVNGYLVVDVTKPR